MSPRRDDPDLDPTVPARPADATLPVTAHATPTLRDPASLPTLEAADMGPLLAAEYEIGEEVARGGMGRVLRAVDLRLGRVVAIKELLGDSSQLRARFAREAQITAFLQHPSIVPIYEAGRWPGGGLAYAMKLVSGQSLDKAIAVARTLAERLALLQRVIDVVDAVAYAHSRRIVHRDIKPSNIILGEFGETILIDWGVAKSLDSTESDDDSALDSDEGRLTSVGAVIGTPVYMAPEQAAGDSIDDRADVYALGALLYHLLSGTPPYRAPDATSVIASVIAGPPAPLETVEPHVPAELVAIVERAMSREPSDRYGAAELAEELRRFTAGNLVAAYRYSSRERLLRWIRRHPAAMTAFLFLVLALAGSIAALVMVLGAKREAQEQRGRAESQTHRSRALLAAHLQEQGRQLLLAGDALRAAVYLAGARAEGARGAGLELLLARARRTLMAQELSLAGHDDIVVDVSFSPDGKALASASRDGTARIWDAHTGAQLASFATGGGSVWTVELSRDGDRLLTTADDGAALWDLRGRHLVRRIPGRRARFDPAGHRVAAAGDDHTVRVWDAESGALVAELAHPAEVTDLHLDDQVLVTASRDGAARIWDLGSGRIRRQLAGEEGMVPKARLSPDRRRLLTAGERARLWDAGSGKLIAELRGHELRILEARFSPDGRLAVTASADGTARLWDPVTGDLRLLLRGHGSAVIDARFDDRGERVLTTSADETARIWDARSGLLLAALVGHTNTVYRGAFSRDGTRVATASYDGLVKVWAVRPEAVLIRGEGPFMAVDGDRLLTARAGSLEVIDLASGEVAETTALPDRRTAVEVSPGWKHLVFEHGADLEVWERPLRGPLAVLPGAALGRTGAAAFGAGDRFLVVAAAEQPVAHVWDLATATRVAALEGHAEIITAIAVSPDGARIATASADATARVWNAADGRQLAILRGHRGSVTDVEFAADGQRVVTGGADGRVQIFDATSGERRGFYDGYKGALNSVSLRRAGDFVLGAGSAGTVLWDARDGKILDAKAPAQLAALSPTGDRYATWSPDGTIEVWPLSLEPWAALSAWLGCAPLRLEAGRLVVNDRARCAAQVVH